MNIQPSTFNAQRPTPNGVRFGASLKVEGSMLKVGRFRKSQSGSVLIIVLWVSIGLVSIALYFANQMTYEMRASDNRVSGLMADQAIEGAARYVGLALLNFATNGAVPDNTQFRCEAVPVGDAKFWLIGRDPAGGNATDPYFGLVDEGGKLNLNNVSTNVFQYLPNVYSDFADAIMDWRGTNGVVALDYTSLGYAPKYAPFETVDELRLVYGASVEMLAGEDLNRNGVADKNKKDLNSNGALDSGLLEYTTVYTREPNFHSDSTRLTNMNTASSAQVRSLLQNASISTSYVPQLMATNPTARPYRGFLGLALRCKNIGMSSDDFARLASNVTTSTNTYFRGRVNVNTANAEVLTALFMGVNVDESTAINAAQTLVTYRQQNPGNLGSIAWIIDSLGNTSPVITGLARGDYVTTRSYQFTADIAAVGPYGRGYRRVKLIFDVSNGTPIILYRQDLSRLGWALGETVRENMVAKNTE